MIDGGHDELQQSLLEAREVAESGETERAIEMLFSIIDRHQAKIPQPYFALIELLLKDGHEGRAIEVFGDYSNILRENEKIDVDTRTYLMAFGASLFSPHTRGEVSSLRNAIGNFKRIDISLVPAFLLHDLPIAPNI